MALDKTKFRNLTYPSSNDQPRFLAYYTASDNKAAVAAANYFVGVKLYVGDIITCVASDGAQLLQVLTVTTDNLGIATASTTQVFAPVAP